MGDHYLIDVGVFEASKQIKLGQETLKSDQDICGFLDRNLTKRLDYNKPLWEIHFFPNIGSGNESVMILICHHSIGDGLSAQMALMCASDDGYDPTSNPIPFKNLTILQRIGLIMAGLFSFPYAFYKNTADNDNPNPLNNKMPVCGIRTNAVSKDFSLDSIK